MTEIKELIEKSQQVEMKLRRVRTAEGSRRYKVPIGTPIGRNGVPIVNARPGRASKTPATVPRTRVAGGRRGMGDIHLDPAWCMI